MTYRDILDTAVGMAGEEIGSTENFDYDEAAPYLLATLCRECASVDKRYRAAYDGGSSPTIPTGAAVDLDGTFPLSDALAPAASYYLCAMLTADENEVLSDKFFSLYTDALISVLASLPATSGKISDRYGLLN